MHKDPEAAAALVSAHGETPGALGPLVIIQSMRSLFRLTTQRSTQILTKLHETDNVRPTHSINWHESSVNLTDESRAWSVATLLVSSDRRDLCVATSNLVHLSDH